MYHPYLKFIVAPMHKPNGLIIRLLEDRKFQGKGFISYQKAKEPIDFFEGELLEENQVTKFWTQKVELAEIENILRRLEKVSIPIISEETIVPQGIKYFLQIGSGTNSITFKWRNQIPAGWEPVRDVANILLHMAGEEFELERENKE